MFECHLHPMTDCLLTCAARGAYRKNSAHRPFHEIPWPNLRTVQVFGLRCCIKTDHQIIPIHAAAHVAGDHESQAPEHWLLSDVIAAGQRAPHT